MLITTATLGFHIAATEPGKDGARLYVTDHDGRALSSNRMHAVKFNSDEVVAIQEALKDRGYSGIEALLAG